MPSLSARLTTLALRVLWDRRWIRTLAGALSPQSRVHRGTRVERVDAPGVAGEWVLSGPESVQALYYIHGGGFSAGSPASERALIARLGRATHAQTFALDYRLAPAHPFPAAVEDTVAGYRWLFKQDVTPASMLMCGTSAGGALALAALVALREAGDPLPAGCVLLSPFLDLTLTGASIATKKGSDVLIKRAGLEWAAARYIGNTDRRHPLASPLFADLKGLPPLLIQVGGDELLLSDSLRLAERARAAGVAVTLRVWEGMFHVFPSAGFLPEAKAAMRDAGTFPGRVFGT